MKKDVYIIGGILALVVAGFVVGAKYTHKSIQEVSTSNELPSSDTTTPTSENAGVKADIKTLMGDGSPSLGPIMAKVVVVEYLDPECEACRAFHPRVKKILSEFDGKIRYMTRHMPYHHNSENAIKALEIANDQGKYWQLLDKLFENQSTWGEKREDTKNLIAGYAKEVGVDMNKYKKEIDNPELAERVKKDKSDGEASGVTGTPSFFINGVLLQDLGEEPLRSAISSALAK